MTKITTDFVGTETAAVTKQRISDILDYWGYEPDIYTTWGNARTDLNDLLAGTALGTIGASELAGTFLPKLNALNSPDELMQALLFSNDEPGVFYDFDDWSTLFQDTAGTQPVTAANQGVALALDKRLGLELGPELVTNGTFDENIDGWTNSTPSAGNISFSAGQLLVERVSGGTSAYQVLACVVGYTYQVLFNFTSVVSGLPRISATSSASTPGSGVTDPQATRFVFVATATTMYIHLGLNSGNGTSGSYDNISVRELKGNHATQATTAARPLTVIHPDGGVRNLADNTDVASGFENGVVANAGTVSFNGATIPVQEFTAGTIVNGTPVGIFKSGVPRPADSNRTFSVLVQNKGNRYIYLNAFNATNVGCVLRVDTQNGASSVVNRINVDADLATGKAVELVSGLWRVTVSYRASSGATTATIGVFCTGELRSSFSSGYLFRNFTEQPTDTFTAGGWMAEDQGDVSLNPDPTPYQKRVNFLDVTEAGKRSIRRLYFNGTSHFMTTPTITPNTDKAQVFAGVRKLSDAATGQILETSTSTDTNNGTVFLRAPSDSAVNAYAFRSRGTQSRQASIPVANFPAPISNTLTALGDISAPLAALRVNGTQVAQSTEDQGTGNYLAYQMFIGARGGTSIFFNGYIDQLITRFGTNLDSGAIETTEKYVSTKVPELVAASEVTWNASTDTYTQNLVGLGR
jgi:hypothetical protein